MCVSRRLGVSELVMGVKFAVSKNRPDKAMKKLELYVCASNRRGAVHKGDRTEHVFAPSKKGLFNFHVNKDIATEVVTTVEENIKFRQCTKAKIACC